MHRGLRETPVCRRDFLHTMHASPERSDDTMTPQTKTAANETTEHTDDHYAALHAGLRWHRPVHFNIAEACCARWARDTPQATAVIHDDAGRITELRYGELQAAANRLSHALRRLGVQRGDRVAIVMPQRFETAIAYMANRTSPMITKVSQAGAAMPTS